MLPRGLSVLVDFLLLFLLAAVVVLLVLPPLLSQLAVVVLVAIIAAGELFGLAGVIVTMPILAAVTAVTVVSTFFLTRLRVRPKVTPVQIVNPRRRPRAPAPQGGETPA